MAEHIIAVFENATAAISAVHSMEAAGIPSAAIRHYAHDDADQVSPGSSVEHNAPHAEGGGFWAWLFGEDTTSQTTYADDVELYDRRVAAGNVIVSVTVEDAMIHQAITALEAHHPLDIDEHSTTDDADNGLGMAPMAGAATTGMGYPASDVARTDSVASAPSGRAAVADAGPVRPAMAAEQPVATAAGSDEVIPLAEEHLEVGKRTVDRGTTRIRRYVVETPVEQEVVLRGERVTVEKRRPVETAAPGTGAFEERVVEVRETAEEPVVAKSAQVVEEVVVGREATERTETVRDNVRREEVEIVKGDKSANSPVR